MPKILTSVFYNMHQSQGPSTSVQWHMILESWLLIRICSVSEVLGARTMPALKPILCVRQVSYWHSTSQRAQQYWKLFKSAPLWILTKNTQGCGKCLFCMEPKSKCQCSEEDKVFILYLMWGVKQFSAPSHRRFCLDSSLAMADIHIGHVPCAINFCSWEIIDNSFWGQF